MDCPTVRRGLSERLGSWNTTCTRLRNGRKRLSGKVATSSSPHKMRPSVGSIRRIRQRAKVDLPEPDSPTMPTVSPACTATWAFCSAAVARLRPIQSRLA